MVRVVTLYCRRGERVRAGAQPPLGTLGGSKTDQLPATAGPSLRVGFGEDRRPPWPGAAVPPAHWTGDRLRPPGGTRSHAGSELSRPDCTDRSLAPAREASASSGHPPTACRSWPSLPYPPGCADRAPGRRPAGTVPSPYSRWLSGGCHSAVTCPSPRQGSADQLITRGKGRAPGRPRPSL